MLAHQNPRFLSLMSSSSLALKESENGWVGAWDCPFTGKETQTQRGQGVVLSHTAMCTSPSVTPASRGMRLLREPSQITSTEALRNWKFCTNSTCCFNLVQPLQLASCLVSICGLSLLFQLRASLPLSG